MKSFAIYFKDLKILTQTQFCETFGTTPREERDDVAPLVVIEREEKNPTIYLGGGVHATYENDGKVLLIAEDTGAVYLTPTAHVNLNLFVGTCRTFAGKENERKEPENLANTNYSKEG